MSGRRNNRERPRRTAGVRLVLGPDHAGGVLSPPTADEPFAARVQQPASPAPAGRTTGEDLTRKARGNPVEVALGRRVLQPYLPELWSLMDRYKAKAREVGLHPKKMPSVLALRYTTIGVPAQAEDEFAAIEHSLGFEAMREFCQDKIAVSGLVIARRVGLSVLVNYTIDGPAKVMDDLRKERALARQFVDRGPGNNLNPIRIPLLDAMGGRGLADKFPANTSGLISEDAVSVELGRLDLVPYAKPKNS